MNKTVFLFLATWSICSIQAQVNVDKPIQLTGSGSDARVSGIQQVTAAGDAVSASSLQSNQLVYAASTNSGNNYAVSLTPAIASLSAGQVVHFTASAANTGAATLNVNGLGAKAIRKNYNLPLAANDIRSGQGVSVMYDAANDWFQMLSQLGNVPASGFGGAGMQLFTSSTTWAVPDGVYSVVIEVWGGGGGGPGISGTNGQGPGGGGGGYGMQSFAVTPGQVLTVTVGAGGTAGATSGAAAGNGGTTSVTGTGVSISATGGTGGRRTPTPLAGTPGSSAAVWNQGGTGGAKDDGAGSSTGGAAGGPLGVTVTATQSNCNTSGLAGVFPGGGGTGAISCSTITNLGSAGAGGAVKIYY